MKPRIAVVGAGPMGVEAALHASVHGYDVTNFLLKIGRDQIREIFGLIGAQHPEAVAVGA